ncbi:alpha-(1,3)-fucosyltransferase FucT-like [Hoplias malabaricus]|uniref:alpha-(1,3)-fucosyltransferase FucT-like n=1 Tax=Hoplias malabaricus TaxID=27720 RepID=UPI003462D26C
MSPNGLFLDSGHNAARNKCCRIAAVCLGLLCVLLLTAITVLWIQLNNLTSQKYQLGTSSSDLTIERDQLQTSYTILTVERNQLLSSYKRLTTERDQLQVSYNDLTIEKDRLQTSYTNLTIERDQLQSNCNTLRNQKDLLQNEKKQLQWKLTELGEEKINFSSSFYFISCTSKSWSKSRDFCRNRGADLVIINSEEQELEKRGAKQQGQ